jgi:hypothetical protein
MSKEAPLPIAFYKSRGGAEPVKEWLMSQNKARIGSSLDAMFEDLGELEEVRILTQKKILARQIEQVRRAGNVSISEMARRMGTSRMAVHSLLDPSKPTMTIDSVSRAAAALGVVLEMKVVARRTPARPPAKPKQKAA